MTMTGKSGQVIKCEPAPLLRNSPLKTLYFGNSRPEGENGAIDDIVIQCDLLRSTLNRKELASSGEITRNGKIIHLFLKEKSSFNTIRIHGANQIPFTAEAYNSTGHRVELTSASAQSDAGFRQLDFDPVEGQQIRIIFASAPGRAPKVEVFESFAVNRYMADSEFTDKVYGEFVLPVYQDKTGIAELTLINTTTEPIPVKVALTGRYSKKSAYPEQKILLAPGRNAVGFDLAQLPHGQFVAHIQDARDPGAVVTGSFRRLLRREILPEYRPVPGKDFKGEKMLFPDGCYFAQSENLQYIPAQAQLHQVSRPRVTPGNTYQRAEHIGVTPDGKLEISIFSCNNMFKKASVQRLRATASSDDLDHWEVVPDNKFKPAVNPNPISVEDPRLDNKPKPGPDGKIRYRFYNAERDGKIDLRQIDFLYISFHSADQIGGGTKYDFEGFIPPQRTSWPIWYKEPGEALVLSREVLINEIRSNGEFELESDSNDNGGGLWLSDDGKSLCYAVCNTMRRYPPYNVPYDNLGGGVRILRVLRICDGLNYERYSMAIPFTDDPVGTQHYNIEPKRLKNNAGLMTGLVYNYNALEQRIFLELTYSRDGYTWKRFHGAKPFVDNGPHGSYSAGYVAGTLDGVEINDKVYSAARYISDAYHILAELMWDRSDSHALSENTLRNHILPRAQNWPLRHRFKDFKEMAEYASNMAFTVALLSWRTDGLFTLSPVPGTVGSFTTLPIRAGNTLCANLQTGDDGFAEFEIIGKNGDPLPGYQKKITEVDSTACPVFDQLPEGEFQVRVKLKNATLYALRF